MITITKQHFDESQYVAIWGQWMHQKNYHCIYNKGLCNAHIYWVKTMMNAAKIVGLDQSVW